MTVLTIDIGNTRTKADLWNSSGHLSHKDYLWNSLPFVTIDNIYNDFLKENSVDKIVVSSVKRDLPEFIEGIKLRTTNEIVNFSEEIGSIYPSKMYYVGLPGADRVAAYLGALSKYPDIPMLVMDCGTALTCDIVNDKGFYCGGNISLGLFSRLKVLANSTSMLPLIEDLNKYKAFGNDTETAIVSGAVNGLIGEILFAHKRAKEIYKIEKCIITGGDAPYLLKELKNQGMDMEYDPYLVGRGLNYHLTIKDGKAL